MRVSHVCPYVGEQMGGSERYVDILSRLQSEKFDVHIYTTTRYADRAGTQNLAGRTFHRFYAPVSIWNINPICLALNELAKSKSDIIHIHSYLYFLANQAALVKIVRQMHALLHIHGGVGNPPYRTNLTRNMVKKLYDRTLGRFTVESSDFVASVSRLDMKLISSAFQVPEGRLRYIPNAVDTDLFHPPESDSSRERKVMLYVGDLEYWKGIGSLINWIRRSNGWDGHFLKFVFIGQGKLMHQLATLQRFLKDRTRRIRIELLGPKPHREIPSIMRMSDALLLPSYWEGMPTVVLEAMAAGLPVISTPVGAIPEVIENLKTGILIDRSPTSFHEAIATILNDKATRVNMQKNARQKIKNEFNCRNVERLIARTYQEIAKQ